jgi:hypothetical protein
VSEDESTRLRTGGWPTSLSVSVAQAADRRAETAGIDSYSATGPYAPRVSVPRVGAIGLDCNDPHVLGTFWSRLLRGEVVLASDDVVAIRVGDLVVNAYRVEAHVAPTWPDGDVPKQLHLDLAVDDLEGAVARAVALGATLVGQQPFPATHMVLLDPAGHPFCLTTEFSTLPAAPR